MSSSDNPQIKTEDSGRVEVYNRVNRLKIKAGIGLNEGPGKINPEAINRADGVVEEMASLYPDEIKSMLQSMRDEWGVLKNSTGDKERSLYIEKLSNTANQIKDLGSTFGYTLMGYFGESLRDFLMVTDLSKDEHYVIIQAHIDVMDVVFREHLKDDDGGSAAEELKEIVEIAIEKYTSQMDEE